MRSVVLHFVCKRKGCSRNIFDLTQCGLLLGKWIIAPGGIVIDHILQVHPDEGEKFISCTDKLKPLSSYGMEAVLLVHNDDNYFENHTLNVGYAFKDLKLLTILRKILKCVSNGVTLRTGNLQGNLDESVFSFAHYIYLRYEHGVHEVATDALLTKQLQIGQQLVAISTPFTAVTLYNSWSQGSLCNIFEDYIALTDIKITTKCNGAAVFVLSNDKKGPLVGLVLGNLVYPRGELTGLNLMSLARSFICTSDLPIFSVYSVVRSNYSKGTKERRCCVEILTSESWGSGIVISQDGLILTCAHLIKFGLIKSCQVRIGGRLLAAKLIFCTPSGNFCELAILKVMDSRINYVPIRLRESPVKLGEKVYSVGFCLFSNTKNPSMIEGIVSKVTQHCVLTTCFVTNGASGGAIVDKQGELIAMILCNFKDNKYIYPHLNLNVAVVSFRTNLEKFIQTRDVQYLEEWYGQLKEDEAPLKFNTICKL